MNGLEHQHPEQLQATTLQLHHAAQFIAAAGRYLVPNQPDDSNTNMEWLSSRKSMVGQWFAANIPARLGLDVVNFSLFIEDQSGQLHFAQTLNGCTIEELEAKLCLALKDAGAVSTDYQTKMHYDIPELNVQKGGVFEADMALLLEVANYFDIAHAAFVEVAAQHEHAQPVRIWPHHFDLGCYVPWRHDDEGAVTHSFSFGLGVADPYSNQPYIYVTHWQKTGVPQYDRLPDLPLGYWNQKDFVGAILQGCEIAKAPDQKAIILQFLEKSIEASLYLLSQ